MLLALKVITDKPDDSNFSAERILLTPEMAMELLEHNTFNRPLSDGHVKRIADQITRGKWRFNGDTIKISSDGKVLDGQHRLWACIEAKIAIETIVVRNVSSDAFATIDTIRKTRSAGDTIALLGNSRHRQIIGASLSWLVRWQRGTIENYRQPQNRIENSDIEEAFNAHPQIAAAVQKAVVNRRIGNPSVIAFLYYVTANRKPDIADQFIAAIDDPSGLALSHPFYQFRAYLTTFTNRRKEPEHTIALGFKALNAFAAGKQIKLLKFINQGVNAEDFPVLRI